MKSVIGTKVGMTQVFATDGRKIPVTVVYVEPNNVLAVKTIEKDGYNAVQVGYETVDKNKLNKPKLGQFKNANSDPKRYIKELRDVTGFNVGDLIKCNTFEIGEIVDVQGITKGHGFTGSIKRHNFKIGPMGHGAGYPHRYTGSIAAGRGGSQAQRVLKNTKMPGHYGHELVTIKNLQIVNIVENENLILIKGAIPGPKNSIIKIKTATHRPNEKEAIEIVNYKKVPVSQEVISETTESAE